MIIDFRTIIGECFVINEGYNIQIIDYVDTKNVLIKFVDRPEIQIWSTMQKIKNGQVKNPLYEGNKIYSPRTCCLLPKEINSTLNSKRHDLDTMKYLYEKYKMDVPYYIRTELYNLTKECSSYELS